MFWSLPELQIQLLPSPRKAFEGIRCKVVFACSELYEDVEEEQVAEEEETSDAEEVAVLVEELQDGLQELPDLPVAESGYYLYVCSQCGSPLTEIPYYNRFLCENCGLHY